VVGLNEFHFPNHLIIYVLNARGEHAGVTMYAGAKYAVCTDKGPQTLPCEALLPGKAND